MSETLEIPDDRGKLGPTGKSVTHCVRKDVGDVRYLEMAMKALREIRDLFGIGAGAESKLGAGAPEGYLPLDALVQRGSIRIQTRWREPVEQRRA